MSPPSVSQQGLCATALALGAIVLAGCTVDLGTKRVDAATRDTAPQRDVRTGVDAKAQDASHETVDISEGVDSSGPQILLAEDFNSGIDRWTPFLNYWRLEEGQWYWGPTDGHGGSGALTHDCCGGDKEAHDGLMMYLGAGAEDWTNYRVEAKLLLRGDEHPLGIWVRGQYEPNETRGQWVTGYYVMVGGAVGGSKRYVRLMQLQTLTDCWGNACANPPNLYNFSNPHELQRVSLEGGFVRHQWYSLVVEVSAERIMAWLDGELAIDFVDSVEPFLTGTVGFKTYKSQTASFDDIVVTPL